MSNELADILTEVVRYLPFREESAALALQEKVNALRTPETVQADANPDAFTVAK